MYAATYFPSINTTYDNTKSGMTSTNVQDAVDELYEVCVPPTITVDQIIEDNNLEKDEYECRYFFTGGNPNNYITFNGEDAGWRIISIECDGRIKIMRIADINTNDNLAWDTSGKNSWTNASLNTYLNGTYYNGLNNAAKSQIVASNFSIGAVEEENNNMGMQVSDENSNKWYGNIALPTASEYIRTNSNKSSCGTFSLNNNNYNSCVSTGWMDTDSGWTGWWTLSPCDLSSSGVYNVYSNGDIGLYNVSDYRVVVPPALYLSSEVQITGGDGTQNNPYTLE